MRISDWSSDVCSSDLQEWHWAGGQTFTKGGESGPKQIEARSVLIAPLCSFETTSRICAVFATVALRQGADALTIDKVQKFQAHAGWLLDALLPGSEIGRASCRERGCQYV